MLYNYSVSVIAFKKNDNKYGMTCAWFMPADYDKMLCLLGTQSVTGHNIQKGDIIGMSILSSDQADIANKLGDKHSNEVDKFIGIDYEEKDSAILINNASRKMVCKVIDVLHLEGIESDNLIYLNILNNEENNDDFLHYSNV
jgi:flavin reductase (DIM6/NTAB) family NADH-FMN oxidoreductase RutF